MIIDPALVLELAARAAEQVASAADHVQALAQSADSFVEEITSASTLTSNWFNGGCGG
ncbi:hypothetical protein [Catellatospora sp. NPDC049133]|jgi:hypothetical protein|uniref:hypothetical protein n=1 Tax=Catellatospora sp. NPDC049133 TaxID=3155499 RepID=UPI0033C3B9C1